MTLKQKERAKNLGKFRTVKEELLAAGYAPSTAQKQPAALTKAKGWLQLLEEKLPDDDLLKVHKEGLAASRVVSSHTEPDYTVPDYQTRAKYLELGYKVKGRLSDNQTFIQANNTESMNVLFE